MTWEAGMPQSASVSDRKRRRRHFAYNAALSRVRQACNEQPLVGGQLLVHLWFEKLGGAEAFEEFADGNPS